MTNPLTSRQRWQLALQLQVLYGPLLLYVNLPEKARTLDSLLHIIPIVIPLSLISLVLYFGGISLTDRIQSRLFDRFGVDFLLGFRWSSVLATFLISVTLSLLYCLIFQQVIHLLIFVLFQLWPNLQPKSGRPPFAPELFEYFQRVNNGFSVVVMLSAFYLTIIARSYLHLKDVQLRAERVEKEAALSQFAALKDQISPHFLFNSLSILTSMIHEDAMLSEQYVKQLAKVYRYILEQRDQDTVPLKTELDFIKAYTFLLQIRFENKFEVVLTISPEVQLQYCIAPLSLQLLIENAVKHNRMSVREPLQIQIQIQDDYLWVANPLQPRDQPEPSTGIGLQNILHRYQLLTDRPVLYGEQAGQFIVKLPLLS
ncbi:sensor histidine kinase [Spirosoma koreense]